MYNQTLQLNIWDILSIYSLLLFEVCLENIWIIITRDLGMILSYPVLRLQVGCSGECGITSSLSLLLGSF